MCPNKLMIRMHNWTGIRHGCFSAFQAEHKGPLRCLPHSVCHMSTPPHDWYSQVLLAWAPHSHVVLCGIMEGGSEVLSECVQL